jgi:hypothetical protein
MKIELFDKIIDLDASECLRDFKTFDPVEWSRVCHAPKWTVEPNRISGGGPDEPTHGQLFCATPVVGDVVLEFDARIIPPSYHDIVWFWNTRFGADPWSGGYLGCLGGWWSGMAGIEKLPTYMPSAIAPSHVCEPGKWYHIVSGSAGASHFIAVDGKLVTYFADADVPDPSKPGYFGFGIYESHAEYANLKVFRPKTQPRRPVYEPGTKKN